MRESIYRLQDVRQLYNARIGRKRGADRHPGGGGGGRARHGPEQHVGHDVGHGQAAREEAIQQAVEDGTITQEWADRMRDRLENMPTQEEMVEAKKQAIQQALDNGQISQEQADWMLEGLENGWTGRGFGGHRGGMFGGFRGPGGFDGTRGPSRPGVSGISL